MKKYYQAGNEVFSVDEVASEEDENAVSLKVTGEKDGKNTEAVVTIAQMPEEVNDPVTYPEFQERLLQDLNALGYTEKDLQIRDIPDGTKVMDIHVHSRMQDKMIVMRIYPPELYKASLEYGYRKVTGRLLRKIRETDTSFSEVNLSDVVIDMDYEGVKENLIIRPLNFTRYAKKLKDGIYQRHGDVALVLYRVLMDTENNLLTHMILKEEIEAWGQKGNEEQILSDALKRTAEKYPAVILDMALDDGVDLMNGDYRREDVITPGGEIMLSSDRGVNGAAAMFYPGVSEKIAELMHGKFAAVFMNTTDVMIVKPDSPYLKGFMEFASHDNESGEMLSGRKYLFNHEGRLINA